jgi:hypothetical protein
MYHSNHIAEWKPYVNSRRRGKYQFLEKEICKTLSDAGVMPELINRQRRSVSYESGLDSVILLKRSMEITESSPRRTASLNAQATPFQPSSDRRWGSESEVPTCSVPPVTMVPRPSSASPLENRQSKQLKYNTLPSHSPRRKIFRSPTYISIQGDTSNGLQHALFDPYTTSPSPLPSHQGHATQINPYAQDPTNGGNPPYYQTPSFQQPLQYHLYTSLGPHRENLHPYQRAAHDFFIPDALREDLQRKSAATLQTLPSMILTTITCHH